MKGCRPLTEAEVAAVMENFHGRYEARDRALFLLGLKSGFRISELLSLRIGDIVQHGKMVDRVTVARRNMKKKTEGRTVILHPDAKEALAEWLEDLRQAGYMTEGDFVFQSERGRNRAISRVQAWRILDDVFDYCGLTGKLGTHSMRKTFADRVHKLTNENIFKTQLALGHKSPASTVSYLSFKQEDIDQAILAI